MGGLAARRPSSPTAKTSEVLLEFLEPCLDGVRTLDEYRTVITIGSAAWNAALLPRHEREDFLAGLTSLVGPVDGRVLRSMLELLIERRLREFSDYGKWIFAFDVGEDGRGFHLQVASADPAAELPLGPTRDCGRPTELGR
jgi:hypothetical protein